MIPIETKVKFSKSFGLHFEEPSLPTYILHDKPQLSLKRLAINGLYVAKLEDEEEKNKVIELHKKLTESFCKSYLREIFNTDIKKVFYHLSQEEKLELVPVEFRTQAIKKKVPIDLGRRQLTIDSIAGFGFTNKALQDVTKLSNDIGEILSKAISEDLGLESNVVNDMNLSLLETVAGAPHQWIHADVQPMDKYDSNQKIGLIALGKEGATFRVIMGSHKLHEVDAEGYSTWLQKKHVNIIHLKQFEYIVCEPTLYHSGTSADETNHRLHFYMNMPRASPDGSGVIVTNDSTYPMEDEDLFSSFFSSAEVSAQNKENVKKRKRAGRKYKNN
jgi:hypothetical protein